MLILTFGRIAENSALEAEWTTLPLTRGGALNQKDASWWNLGCALTF